MRVANRRFGGVFASVAIAFAFLANANSASADMALSITPTFGASITGDPNGAAIIAVINSAIDYYEATFTTKTAVVVDVTIKFDSMGSGLGGSLTGLNKLRYKAVIDALIAASSGNATDTTALAHLPSAVANPVTGSDFINGKTANLRALGFATPGFVDGTFDGKIGLNTHITDIGSPGTTGEYSLFAVVQHEIDEVIGLGSDVGGSGFFADPAMQDLFRYDHTGTGTRNYTTAGDDAFFSIDGINNLVQYNQDGFGDYGDWHPSATARVQDAYATPFEHPTLATSAGLVEVINLDAIGYNIQGPAVVPEPSSVALLLIGSMSLVGYRWRQRGGKLATR